MSFIEIVNKDRHSEKELLTLVKSQQDEPVICHPQCLLHVPSRDLSTPSPSKGGFYLSQLTSHELHRGSFDFHDGSSVSHCVPSNEDDVLFKRASLEVEKDYPKSMKGNRINQLRHASTVELDYSHGLCCSSNDPLLQHKYWKMLSNGVKIPTTDSRVFHSVGTTQGKRIYMEDRHLIHYCKLSKQPNNADDPDIHNIAFYGVFDGHGGDTCADYLRSHIHENILEHPSFLTDPVLSIYEGFDAIEKSFLEKARLSNCDDGSTAIVAIVINHLLIVGNVGDCRCVLGRRDTVLEMSRDHKPHVESERKRIRENFGDIRRKSRKINTCCCFGNIEYVGPYRIYPSGLAVSRTMGDLFAKDTSRGLVVSGNMLSSEVEVRQTHLCSDDQFFIVASDGFWDVITSDEAIELILEALSRNLCKPENMGHWLVERAHSFGSMDNITVIVVFLSIE